MTTSRREILKAIPAAAVVAAAGAVPAGAIPPFTRTGTPRLRLGLAGYSMRDHLTGKLEPAMDLHGFIEKAAHWDVDAVELTSYYFPKDFESAAGFDSAYVAGLKRHCHLLGLDVSTTPIRLGTSRMASRGHARAQPPHPWHIPGKTRARPDGTTIAWKRQARLHAPQPSQRSGSTSGTGTATTSLPRGTPFRKRWAFGSSTSQSARTTGPPCTRARLTAIVVLPVPPLPDAIASRGGRPLSPGRPSTPVKPSAPARPPRGPPRGARRETPRAPPRRSRRSTDRPGSPPPPARGTRWARSGR